MTPEGLDQFNKLVDTIVSEKEVRSCYDILRSRQRCLRADVAATLAAALKKGAKVTFETRRGVAMVGTVLRVNLTTATVKVVGQQVPWRVALPLLTTHET